MKGFGINKRHGWNQAYNTETKPKDLEGRERPFKFYEQEFFRYLLGLHSSKCLPCL